MNGLFGQQQQMPPNMYPQGTPQMPPVPNVGQSPTQEASSPQYVGDPTLDKYIHMFIGDM